MLNTSNIAEKMAALSSEEAAVLLINPETSLPVSAVTLGKWRANPANMPLWAAEKIAATQGVASNSPKDPNAPDPGFMQIDPSWSNLPADGKTKLMIGFPTSGHSTHTKTLFGLLALQARHGNKIFVMPCENNPVGRARNILATQFLMHPSKPDWLLFIDNDMVIPVGSEPWAKQVWAQLGGAPVLGPNMDIVSRLVSHGKPLVGAFYVGRGPQGVGQFAECYENVGINRLAHAGPKNELRPTKWVATGGLLINRSVLLAIVEKFPELKPRHADDPYRFFAMEDDEGEDMLFCKRAREAGIQPYVDMGCHCGHEGNYIFWPHNTSPVAPQAGQFLGAKELIAVKAASVNPPSTVSDGHLQASINNGTAPASTSPIPVKTEIYTPKAVAAVPVTEDEVEAAPAGLNV